MARVERRTQPASWRAFPVSRESAVEAARRLKLATEEATKRAAVVVIYVDGFEGAFDTPEELLETISKRQWRLVRSFEIRLVDSGPRHPLNVSFIWSRRGKVFLELTGGERVLRNGLMLDLKEVVEQLIRHEARSRYRRLLRLLRDTNEENEDVVNWQAVGALIGFLVLLATVITAMLQLHVFGS